MIKTYDEAQQALRNAESDVAGDMGEEAVEAGWSDIVEAVTWDCTPEIARELCRRELGWIPQTVRARLAG